MPMGESDKLQHLAAYKMLKLLAQADGTISAAEKQKLSEFTRKELGDVLELTFIDLEIERLKEPDTLEYFDRAAEQFYLHSNRDQRKAFILQAIHMVRTDQFLDPTENTMINRLFSAWLS
jgi:uncharacterized tellurite resistance protein B-like protein